MTTEEKKIECNHPPADHCVDKEYDSIRCSDCGEFICPGCLAERD